MNIAPVPLDGVVGALCSSNSISAIFLNYS
jgi:hypothetical protein